MTPRPASSEVLPSNDDSANENEMRTTTAVTTAVGDSGDVSLTLQDMVCNEVEQLRRRGQQQRGRTGNSINNSSKAAVVGKRESDQLQPPLQQQNPTYHSFPPACLRLLQSIEGNQRCVDCGNVDPQWAAVSYGALLCLHCSGHHRSLGVTVSCVRSISMDEWSLQHILAMLEGGNCQLEGFFSRHALTEKSCPSKPEEQQQQAASASSPQKCITKKNVTRLRYKTKAALFYRQQMNVHVAKILEAGPYRGRELSRTKSKSPSAPSSTVRRQRRLEHRNTTVE